MWSYERRLEFPVNIKEPNAQLAQAIISQYGGPDGEIIDYKTLITGFLFYIPNKSFISQHSILHLLAII